MPAQTSTCSLWLLAALTPLACIGNAWGQAAVPVPSTRPKVSEKAIPLPDSLRDRKVVPVPDRTPAAAKSVLRWTLRTEDQLRERLAGKQDEGLVAAGVIPVANEQSLYVFEATPATRAWRYSILTVMEPLSPATLQKSLDAHPGQRFLGIHRIDDSSFLAVFAL